MNLESKITLVGAGSILLLDTIASFLSAHFQFSSTVFCPASLVVYFGMTYWAAKHWNLWRTLGFGAFLALVDATIGWKVSDWLGADPQYQLQRITVGMWWETTVGVMILGVLIALIAFLIASRRKKGERQ